jgi:iron-sulfur cluster repair protein YtfE (RIC family)
MEYHPCLLRLLDDHKQAFFLAQVCKKRRTQPQGIPTSPREKAVFAHGFFQSLMAEHLFLEEEILFNYVRIHARGMEPLLLELTMEHQRMAELLVSLKNSDQLADELEALGFFMEIHLRREETELFPIIQASLTSAQLDEVEQQFLHVLEPQQLESVDSGN